MLYPEQKTEGDLNLLSLYQQLTGLPLKYTNSLIHEIIQELGGKLPQNGVWFHLTEALGETRMRPEYSLLHPGSRRRAGEALHEVQLAAVSLCSDKSES